MTTDGAALEVQRTERSGVPVFWADHTGPCMGALLVRSGQADETLRTSGINHLVEHLALFPLGRPAYTYNGRVEDVFTLFYAQGTPEEVAAFLTTVGRQLADLPVDRLEVERRVLATEAEGRSPSLDARLLSLRFGPRGFGMVKQPELGLGWLGADELRGWAAERFTTGNAAVWMSREPPADLAIGLPPGERHPPPAPETIPTLVLPCELQQGTGGVALTVVGRRSMALTAAMSIASERGFERLRRDAGLSYSVNGGYLPLDATTVHATLQADCQDRDAARVRDELLRVLDELAEHGPTDEELERDRRQYDRREEEDPDAILGHLDFAARETLFGNALESPDELRRERHELTAEAVGAAAAQALESLLVLIPAGTTRASESRFSTYDPADTTPVSGTDHLPTDLWTARGTDTRLTVGPDGVTMATRSGEDPLTIRYAECVAAVPLLSGAVTLVDRSGAWLTMNPHAFRRGVNALDRIREAFDDADERVVPLTVQERALRPIVLEQLVDDLERVAPEVDALPPILDPDELPVHLASAAHGELDGLLVVTDRRVLFVDTGGDGTLIELERDKVQARAKGRLRRKTLELSTPDATYELRLTRPALLDELALALR